jgi:osmotically-inducible protein OsmY
MAPLSRLLRLVPRQPLPPMALRQHASPRVAFAPGADDSFVNAAVKCALQREPEVGHAGIHVSTSRGVVQLSGFVDSRKVIARAVQTARSVAGVRAVMNDIRRV